MFFTALIKTQTRIIEKDIQIHEAKINKLKNNIHEAQLDYFYLSSPNILTNKIIEFSDEEYVNIVIFDVMGRNIRSLVNQKKNAGYHSIQWDAKNDLGEPVSAGMYIYILQAGDYRSVKKMVLLK